MMVSEINNTVIAALKVNIVIIKYTMNACTLNYIQKLPYTLDDRRIFL